jgi:DNA repair exonuclease SbcCD ATPase subunit
MHIIFLTRKDKIMTDEFMELFDAPDTTENQDPAEPETRQQAVQVRDPLDPGPVIALFGRFHGEIDRMASQVEGVQVTNPAENDHASTLTLQCKNLHNTLEKKRQKIKEPYLNVTRLLDSEVKALRDRLSGIQSGLNRKIQAFLMEEQKKRDAERRRQEAQQRAEQARLDAEYRAKNEELARAVREKAEAEAREKGADEAAAKQAAEQAAQEAEAQAQPAPIVVMPEPPPVMSRSDHGTAKLKTKTAWKVADFRQLPDELFQARWEMLEKAAAPWINAQVKAGRIQIPGVEIYQETQLETRTRR